MRTRIMTYSRPAFLVILVFSFVHPAFCQCPASNDTFLVHCIDPQKQDIRLFWKDDKNQPFRDFENLRNWLAQRKYQLVFAMNGGMYMTDNSPVGLFIDSGKLMRPVNRKSASGNFYLKPNGIFYVTWKKTAAVVATEKFRITRDIKYATQSGPMLVIEGSIHSAFTPGSANINIRNGVGIMPDGHIMLVMSKRLVNLYDFGNFFLRSGCRNALYLDGSVSRTYLPAQNYWQTGGNFGVIIAEVTASR